MSDRGCPSPSSAAALRHGGNSSLTIRRSILALTLLLTLATGWLFTPIAVADGPGVSISPTSLEVDEGGTATYSVRLTSQPTGDVTVKTASGDTNVATVSGALTFTTENWATAQTVTVTGVDDNERSKRSVTIWHRAGGGGYDGIGVPEVRVTVTDNEPPPGVTVSATQVSVAEAGGTATYSVALTSQPAGDVTITPTSSDASIATVSGALTFGTGSWSSPQTVTVTGVNDDATGDRSATIKHAVSGADYGGVSAPSVSVTVTNDDAEVTRGVTVSATEVSVAEAGGTATYTVVLDSQPTGDVTITPASSDANAATVSGALTFNTDNWGSAQTVTVTGVNDDVAGDRSATIKHAVSGADYGGVSAPTVSVTVTNDDAEVTRGVTVSASAISVAEAGGTATYTLALTSQPTGDVTITPASSDANAATVSGALTFNTDNWRSAQTVTVTGVNDDVTGDRSATISHTVSGADYDGVSAASVNVTVTDDDAAPGVGVTVSPTEVSVAEAGGTATYTVVLTSQPTDSVTISPISSDANIATVTGALTFTAENWATAQTVTVTGVNDDATGDRSATIGHATGGASTTSGGMPTVHVTVTDDDAAPTAGVTISATEVSVAEAGGTATYTAVLDSQPTGDVTVTPASSDANAATVSGALTFTTENWAAAQTVTVTGVNDDATGDRSATISHTVAGADYEGVSASDVSVTVTDDDAAPSAGVTVTPTELSVAELGGTATYTVALTSQPTGDVTITPVSNDTSAATVSGALTFTTETWATAQTVTVSGVSDEVQDLDRSVTITHTVAGADYANVTAPSVSVTVTEGAATAAAAAASAPTGVSVAPGTSAGTLTVTWTAASDAESHRVQWKSGTENWDETNRQRSVSGASTTTDTIPSLTGGTTYTVRVGTVKSNAVATGDWSAGVTGTALASNPTNVTVTPGGSQLTVTWTAASGADSYRVQWKSGTQDWDETNRQRSVSGGSTTTDTIPSLDVGTAYTVRVGAVKSGNVATGDWSADASGTPTYGCAGSTAITGVGGLTGTLLVTDCETLLGLKGDLDPNDTLNWATTRAMRSWDGLHVDGSPSRVSQLQLLHKSLNGTLPAALGQLTGLRKLVLSSDGLSGSIPSELGQLTNLTELGLSDQSLSGGIPSQLGSLSNLTKLSLYSNRLSGAIPSQLGSLSNLTELRLSSNQLSGAIPSQLGSLSKLTQLYLHINKLSGSIPAELGSLSKLVRLRLSSNQLTGSLPAELGNLGNLTHLYLTSNQLSGNLPPELGNLGKVTQLRLNKNQFSGEIPSQLGSLAKVVNFNLSENQLSGAIPGELGSLTKASHFQLQNNQLSGAIPAGLGGLGSVRLFDLSNNQLDGAIPVELGNLSTAETLYLAYNQLSDSIPKELGQLTNLYWLSLRSNRLTGEIPTELGNLGSNATGLLLDRNKLSGSIPAELGNLPNLAYLYLHRNHLSGPIPAGTDSGSNATGLAKLSKLSYLYLSCNDLSGTIPEELGDLSSLSRLGVRHGNPKLAIGNDAEVKAKVDATAKLKCTGEYVVPDPPAAAQPQPAIGVAVSGPSSPVNVGDTLSYTVTVRNTGGAEVTGVFWRSPELGVSGSRLGDGTLGPGESASATASFGPVTTAHLPGPIVITFHGDSDQTDDPSASHSVAINAPATAPALADVRPLGHNITDLWVTHTDGTRTACFFLSHYETAGGLARWGYATSELLEERPGVLTQYYQRGAVDCHFRDGTWRVERRLTWDYVGGDLHNATDLGFEPDLRSEHPGLFPGPWGHRVTNYAVDGTHTGFLDYFQAYGGVTAFGYPKTEARRDDDPAAVLRLPGAEPGVVRQYFQSAVFEYHPGDEVDPVRLGLPRDLLRDLVYPNQGYLQVVGFKPTIPISTGESSATGSLTWTAERVVWQTPGAQTPAG